MRKIDFLPNFAMPQRGCRPYPPLPLVLRFQVLWFGDMFRDTIEGILSCWYCCRESGGAMALVLRTSSWAWPSHFLEGTCAPDSVAETSC